MLIAARRHGPPNFGQHRDGAEQPGVATPVVDMARWLFSNAAEYGPGGVGGAFCQAGTLADGELDDATQGGAHAVAPICWAAGTRAGRRTTLGQLYR